MQNTLEKWTARLTAVVLVLVSMSGPCGRAAAQDTTDPRLPTSARLALRARAGDVIRMESTRKVTSRARLEVVSFDFFIETNDRESIGAQYQGAGPNGTLNFEIHDTARVTTSKASDVPVKPQTVSVTGLYAFAANLRAVRRPGAPAAHVQATRGAGGGDARTMSIGYVLFPDRELKPGDTWSGTTIIKDRGQLDGVTLRYDSTLVGFEIYQDLPCARVETAYTYHGPLPGLNALIRKQLPTGAKVDASAELTGNETTFFALDRGWPLNSQAKFTVALNMALTQQGQTLEVGGTVDSEQHFAVTGYPPYDKALAAKATVGAVKP